MHRGKLKRGIALAMCASMIFATGCSFSFEKETKKVAPVAKTLEAEKFSYVTASNMDVVRTDSVNVEYKTNKSWAMKFNESSYKITNVYCSVGDTVKKGDLLIECVPVGKGDLNKTIEELNGYIEQYTKDVEYYENLVSFEEQRQDIYIAYGEEFDTTLLDNYNTQLKAAQKDLNVATYSLEETIAELDKCQIFAPKDGKIGFVNPAKRTDILSSADVAVTVLEEMPSISTVTKKFDYFTEGEEYKASFYFKNFIENEGNAGSKNHNSKNLVEGVDYTLEEVVLTLKCISKEPVSEGSETYEVNFSLVAGDDSKFVESTTNQKGTITVILEEALNVVAIPSNTLIRSGDRYAVYMENEDGSRRIQYVETGITAADYTEITSGLSAGDIIITDLIIDNGEEK